MGWELLEPYFKYQANKSGEGGFPRTQQVFRQHCFIPNKMTVAVIAVRSRVSSGYRHTLLCLSPMRLGPDRTGGRHERHRHLSLRCGKQKGSDLKRVHSVNLHGLQSVSHPTKEFLFCSFSQVNKGSKQLSSGLTSICFFPTMFSNARVQGSDFPSFSIWLREKKRGRCRAFRGISDVHTIYMYDLWFLLFGFGKFAPAHKKLMHVSGCIHTLISSPFQVLQRKLCSNDMEKGGGPSSHHVVQVPV